MGMLRSRVFGLAIALAAATVSMAQPQQQITKQTTRSDWARVQQIQPKQKIKVYLVDGTALRGTFSEAGPEGLSLLVGGKPPSVRNVSKGEILRISSNSRRQGALIGGVTAGALGFGVGAALAGEGIQHDLQASRVAIGALVGGLFAGAGSGLGVAFGSERTIYEAVRLRAPARR